MKPIKRKSSEKMTKAGKEILAGLLEIKAALEEGVPLEQRFTVREVEVLDPGEYNALTVRKTRAKLGVSQAVFARIIGVSTILVQSWENGKRTPNAPVRRVLDEMNREPKRWLNMLRPAPHPSRRVD